MQPQIQQLFDLSGKTALVTGAASGIGLRMAQALAGAGADLVVIGRQAEKLHQAASTLPSTNSIHEIVLDLHDVDDWDAVVAENHLSVDIVANVAGINLRQPYADITPESWDQTLDINLKIPFFLARALIPNMRAKGWGKIINIASLQSSRAFPNSFPYGASKGGIVQLTRAMAEAWSVYGITANAIAPGFFATQLTQAVFADPAIAERNARQTAIGRNGEMADLDGLSVFLASPASDYITGQTIYLDGGFSAK